MEVGNSISKYMKPITENIWKNRAEQNRLDTKNFTKIDDNQQTENTNTVNKAKKELAFTSNTQSTGILSDPKEDALRRALLFKDASKTS